MQIGSLSEDIKLEKRVAITPEIVKKYKGLGLEVCLSKDYALHLGISDKDYEVEGASVLSTEEEVISKSDDKLVRYVKKKHKIIIFRGSLKNKVKRWYNCFLKHKLKSACFIDGDDLLFDYQLYKKNFIKAKTISIPYMLKNPKNIVTGAFTYIINFKFLKQIYKKSQKFKDVDVIDRFYKNVNKIENIKLEKMLVNKKIRLTLDYKDDYIFFKKLFKIFNSRSNTKEVIKYLEKHSELSKINFFLNKSWKLNQLKQKKNL